MGALSPIRAPFIHNSPIAWKPFYSICGTSFHRTPFHWGPQFHEGPSFPWEPLFSMKSPLLLNLFYFLVGPIFPHEPFFAHGGPFFFSKPLFPMRVPLTHEGLFFKETPSFSLRPILFYEGSSGLLRSLSSYSCNWHIYQWGPFCIKGPYHIDLIGSRPITAVKQCRALLELGWVT